MSLACAPFTFFREEKMSLGLLPTPVSEKRRQHYSLPLTYFRKVEVTSLFSAFLIMSERRRCYHCRLSWPFKRGEGVTIVCSSILFSGGGNTLREETSSLFSALLAFPSRRQIVTVVCFISPDPRERSSLPS